MRDQMLTTYDNPFDPFTEFDAWWKYDTVVLGYDCCGLLAREAMTSEVFSDEKNKQITTDAMNRIVKNNPTLYKIVYK